MAKFIVKTASKERTAENEQEILEWFLAGKCNPGSFVYSTTDKTWTTVAHLPAIALYFAQKPNVAVEKNVIHVMHGGPNSYQAGPYSLSQVKQQLQAGELCAQSWIFVDGDKEWRQVQNVKLLKDFLPPLPVTPANEVSPADILGLEANTPTTPIMGTPRPGQDPSVEYAEELTNAISPLGLSSSGSQSPLPGLGVEGVALPGLELEEEKTPVKTPPPIGVQAAPKGVGTDPKLDKDQSSYDGITAEISSDPIWLVKKSDSENILGPYKFLEVVKFLEEGKLSKNDKISKTGSNRYAKILQQYEFNVKYTVETLVEGGIEKQKILIRRRHPRVPYMADVQVTRKGVTTLVSCVNISAGGILIETSKVDFTLGEMVEIKILPGLISRTTLCKALVIGKIPKIPPGYALKFEELKTEDKEAIEYFVQTALKKEALRV